MTEREELISRINDYALSLDTLVNDADTVGDDTYDTMILIGVEDAKEFSDFLRTVASRMEQEG